MCPERLARQGELFGARFLYRALVVFGEELFFDGGRLREHLSLGEPVDCMVCAITNATVFECLRSCGQSIGFQIAAQRLKVTLGERV